MKTLILKVFLFGVLLFLTGCFSDKDTSPILPEATLNSHELRSLFIGNTVESYTVSRGRKSITYYDPNGEARQSRDGDKRLGQWRISKKGRICLKMEGGREKCRIITNENGTYTKWVVKKDGNHKAVVTYGRFIKGNPLGL